ncbi:MAG: ABC transporter substrate-binding protein [Spirochaetales bacterium]|nr:ABC transporter substrate-binding protein [Spirochaetales bacterium]
MINKAGVFFALFLTVFFFSCAKQKTEVFGTAISLAVLPVLDALPLYVGQEEGFFLEQGLDLEILQVASPFERDQLLQTGSAQAMLNELSGLMFFNQEKILLQAVLTSRKAESNKAVFQILSAPESAIIKPSDLAGVPVAVSEKTVIEYITTRILQKSGLSDKQIIFQNVPVIPERFGLLMAGKIRAATLPAPLSLVALQSGAHLVVDDTVVPELSLSVISFQKKFIDQHPLAVKAFVKAWNMAVVQLNSHKSDYRPLLAKHIPVPDALDAVYELPDFPTKEYPDSKQWEDTAKWMKDRVLINKVPSYFDSINPFFME